jgi:hypothetical protein
MLFRRRGSAEPLLGGGPALGSIAENHREPQPLPKRIERSPSMIGASLVSMRTARIV